MRGEDDCRYSILAMRSSKNPMKIKEKTLQDAYKMHKANMLLLHISEVTGIPENIITKYIQERKTKRALPIRRKTI